MTDFGGACRSCGAEPLQLVLTLGQIPLANALLRESELDRPEPRYPLDLAFCSSCALVQITFSVPPDELFRDYPYFSSMSDTMLRHAENLASRLRTLRDLGETSLVVEVGSNDGYLLQYYKAAGIPVLGIEPARNVARAAVNERGIPTITEFFGEVLAHKLAGEGVSADVLHANNVLAHVPDPNGFVAGIAALLKNTGVAVIEVPHVAEMIDRCEFDTIYHEHLCYFSLSSLTVLFERHGLVITDVEQLAIHGGSLRVHTAHGGGPAPSTRVRDLLDEEKRRGLCRIEYYQAMAARVEELKADLRALLDGFKAEGKSVAAYGAAAKGSILLNYLGVGRGTIDFVVDRSPHKQGRLMPGVHLPIEPPEALLDRMPDFVLLLTWNLKDEVLEQQAEYRARGGKFIVPIPELTVV